MTTLNQHQGGSGFAPELDSKSFFIRELTQRPDFADKIRGSVVTADTIGTVELDAACVWHDLVGARRRIVAELFERDSCYLVLAHQSGSPPPVVDARRLAILQAVLAGSPQNNVAIDLRLAPSTVALHAKQGLEALGGRDKPSRAHPLLMLAAMAATEPSRAVVRASYFSCDGQQLLVAAAPRPELHLQHVLPAAELAVVRGLVEGFSYVDIAAKRGTSTRTIANQIAGVFRRLHVSGRNDLVRRLLIDAGLVRLLSTPVSRPRTGVAASALRVAS